MSAAGTIPCVQGPVRLQRVGLSIHASAIVIGETGVLIRGESGAGKSSLARRMIEMAQARGLFARLIGDDRIVLAVAGGRLLARPHPAIAGQIEARGRGILDMAHEPAAPIRCVIDLVRDAPGCGELTRLPGQDQMAVQIESIALPRQILAGFGKNTTPEAEAMAFVEDFRRQGDKSG